MKKIYFILPALIISIAVWAQQRACLPTNLKDVAVEWQKPVLESQNSLPGNAVTMLPLWPPAEETIGDTYFDLQSNSAMQNRFYYYPDGTFAATWTIGFNYPGFADDRGTGYNYFDGSAWGVWPTQRIEPDRTGWPAYAPLGESGEIVVSHLSGGSADGLIICTRDERGTGDWNDTILPGPEGSPALAWPRIATGGIDHSVIHLIALTLPTANGGVVYQGQDGALLYSRSSDGGKTWDPLFELPDEINSNYYLGFDGDTYEIQADGDNVAILIGAPWVDMILLKSTNSGDTWTKTLVWENPYPMWTTGTVTDTFYCVDGAHSMAFDQSGMIHIAFGINRALSADGTNQSWFPFVDGVGYWKENMPVFSNNVNALNPYGEAGTELIDDYNLIGWTQDVDGDGVITFVGTAIDNIGTYQLGLSSMPQILVDELNQVFVVWSSVTETYDNGLKNYRRLWCRSSLNSGDTWSEDFFNLTDYIGHVLDECEWPAMASNSDANFYLIYQFDNEPGLAVRFEEQDYVENFINYMEVLKSDVLPSVGENAWNSGIVVSQNSPNPASDLTDVFITLENDAYLRMDLFNITGHSLFSIDGGHVNPGRHKITLDVTELPPGVYFYTVDANGSKITRKMIVE